MADIEKSIKLNVDASESIESLGRLRRELASLNAQVEETERGTEAFNKLQNEIKKTEQAVKKAEGAFGDATDKIRTLSGSGVERANASFGLLREGIQNLDFGKFKIGLQGVTGGFRALGGAIAATGIGLLVIGVVQLIENFDKLKSAGGLVGQVFTAIGDTITFILDGLQELSDAIGLTDSKAAAAQEAADARNKKALEERLGLVDKVKKSYEDQIAVAKAAGRDTTDLENKSAAAQRQILKTNIEYLENIAKQSTFFADVIEPVLNAQRDKLKELDQEEKVRTATRRKEASEDAADEKKKREEKDKARLDALAKEASDDLDAKERGKKAEAKFLADMKALNEQAGNELAALADAELNDLALRNEQKLSAEKAYTDMVKEEEEKRVKARKEAIDRGFEITNAGLNALSSLNDLFTTLETNRLKKGEKASLDLQKKQFRRGKALAVAQTGINTAQAIVRALADPGGIPGVVLSVAAGITGAAQIAAILAKKFNPETGDTGGGDTGSTSTPSLGGAGQSSFIAPPTFSLGGQQIGGAGNILGTGGGSQGQQPIKVFVSETDISNVQGKVQVTQGNSLFGGGG